MNRVLERDRQSLTSLSPHATGLRLGMVSITGLAALLTLLEGAAVIQENPGVPGNAVAVVLAFPIGALIYALAGVLAWSRRPRNPIGAIMIGGSAAMFTAGFVNTSLPIPAALGVISQTVPIAVVVHLVLAYPSGRVRSRPARWAVGAVYATALVLEVPIYLLDPARSLNADLAVGNRPDLADAFVQLQVAVGLAIMVLAAIILALRVRAAQVGPRAALLPLYLYGVLTAVAVPFLYDVARPALGLSPINTALAQVIVLTGVPVVFTIAGLCGGFSRISGVDELSGWLATADNARPPLRTALARALGDPTIELLFARPGGEGYLDAAGHPLSAPGPERELVPVRQAGEVIAAISYDPMLAADAETIAAAGRVVAIELDRERLTAQLLASQQELRTSRVRIVESADRERARIAADLHDGLQVQLVLLALQAQQVADAEDVGVAAERLRLGIDAAAAGLRTLVQDVMPAPLIERGLGAATEDLVDHLPMPTKLRLELTDGELPAMIESTAYFIIAEALTNAVKHACAQRASVCLARREDWLHIEVADDGVGGAVPGSGFGLRGMADRIDALGGRLAVVSPVGHGTRVTVSIPCG